jgi:hypothetical protein
MPIGQPGVYWPFKALLEGSGITLQETASAITITVTGSGTGGTGDMLKSEYAPSGISGEVDHAILADTATKCNHSALADAVPWNGVTGAPASFPSDWSVITNKPNLFPPLPHAPQHVGGSDPIGLASATAAGLLAQLSGKSSDYVGGDNASHPIPTATDRFVIGDSVSDPQVPNGIFIPQFKNHPDAIWTPQTSFDDGFDGATLDPKWTYTAGLLNPVMELVASRVHIAGNQGNSTAVINSNIQQRIPNANPFTVTCKVEALLMPYNIGAGNSNLGEAAADVSLLNPSGSGLVIRWLCTQTNGENPTNSLTFYYGASLGTTRGLVVSSLSSPVKYVRIVYDGTNYIISFSANGVNWLQTTRLVAAGIVGPPVTGTVFRLGARAAYDGSASAAMDWVKFTNP